MISRIITVSALVALCGVAEAQDTGIAPSTYSGGMLVTANDVMTCPYTVVGPVSVAKRGSMLSSNSTQAVYDKLRVKAKKLGADAVVLVTIGEGHMTVMSFNQKNATGRAIKYVDRSCAPTQ